MASAIAIFGTLVLLRFIHRFLVDFIPKMITKASSDEKRLILLIKEQKHQLFLMDAQNEFAKFAKLQRQITKNENELSKKATECQKKGLKTKGIMWSFCTILSMCCHFWLVWTYRNIPVAQLPSKWLSPLSTVLKFPTAVDGAIGLPCWLLISNSVIYLMQSC